MTVDPSKDYRLTPDNDIRHLLRQNTLLKQELIACRKREKKLTRKEKLYRLYFRENVAGAYISTPAGRLLLCNREFLNIFGIGSIAQAMAMSAEALYLTPADRKEFIALLKKKKRVKGYHQALKRVDGKKIHLLHNSFAVNDKNGCLEYIQGFLLDITLQRQLEAQLRKAQKMEAMGNLAGGIAHDFNNILSGILGNAQLAGNRMNFPEKVKANLTNIITGAQRASELVQQILTFSRQAEYKKKYIRLEGVIAEVVKFIRSTIPASIEIHTQVKPTGKILADPAQMHRLLMNLCINAFHAMQDNLIGRLSISLNQISITRGISSAYPPGTYLKLKISDTGHGIDNTNMDRIFEPYFTTNIDGGGTGLGLASVRSIIEEHNGYIKVDSILGKGSDFNIYLPIAVQKEAALRKKENIKIPSMGSGTIMVVDDEEQICTAYREILEEFGFTVHTCPDGLRGLNLLGKTPGRFDLIITDLNMPRMRGDQFIIEALKIKNNIPIILCTGYSEGIGNADALELGARELLKKPIDMHDLVSSVNRILRIGSKIT